MSLPTIAACDRCGRGYVHISQWGVRCMVGGCDGTVWYLPVAHDNRGRHEDVREQALMAKQHLRETPPEGQ